MQASIVRLGNHRGMAASPSEPICLLYARTGENNTLILPKRL
jgi:hypothetical protein